MSSPTTTSLRWYDGVTRYQWLVLIIASAGWMFDAFEGQLFNITRHEMLSDILGQSGTQADVKIWGERFLGIFLLGGTLGGLLFSSLADKWGRKPAMLLSILFYSLFTGLTASATELWHVAALRFLVAIGVGGEWAVGAALVAEVFPSHARARAGGIFHASSIIGLWLAAGAGLWVGDHWRMAYLIGILPAILVFWVRKSVKEPASWLEARANKTNKLGSYRELLGDPIMRSRAIWGALLAMVGLATFWGVVVAGQDLAAEMLKEAHVPIEEARSRSKIAYGFVQAFGALLGMLSFGPLSVRFGCRRTFMLMHVCAFIITPLVCWLPSILGSYALLLCMLPLLGFFAQGIHAGYAVYFPTLFPTHLRATGAGFCFNTGRILAAPVLIWLSAWLKAEMDMRMAITLLSGFFLIGLLFLVLLPETRNGDLME